MAKFIIDNLIYDTEKSEEVCEYMPTFISGRREVTLYKTKSGRWFIVNYRKSEAKTITEEDAKDALIRLNDVELYEKYFEKLQEA